MCLVVWLFDAHPKLPLLVLFNRDEFFDRPTTQLHWWEDHPSLLAGRDLVGGGTWLGITHTGRFAFVTNYREVNFNAVENGPSRGDLPTNYLKGNQSPMQYLESINLLEHNGFNLIVGDLATKELAYMTNRGDGPSSPIRLSPGVHAISNSTLRAPWPKVMRSVELIEVMLQHQDLENGGPLDWEGLFSDVMGDRQLVEDPAALPTTGLSLEMESRCSAIFLEPWEHEFRLYGTRSQTGIAVWQDGHVEVRERNIDPEGQTDTSEVHVAFFLSGLAGEENVDADL